MPKRVALRSQLVPVFTFIASSRYSQCNRHNQDHIRALLVAGQTMSKMGGICFSQVSMEQIDCLRRMLGTKSFGCSSD